MCFADAECVNQAGSYTCACMKGFTFNEDTEICEGISVNKVFKHYGKISVDITF